jgi:hypothetical protein
MKNDLGLYHHGCKGADVRPLFDRERMQERLRNRAAELQQ